MLKCGRANFTGCHLLGIAFLGLSSVGVVAALAGVRINTSYSLPIGFYVRTTNSQAPLIEFCPIEPFAHESSVRGYRTNGTACPDGGVPLLKPVVAVPGDRVVLSAGGITVNGRPLPHTARLGRDAKGRLLRAWPFGSYVVGAETVWVASTYNRGSYDSRYMGPINLTQIRARLRPLWLL